VKPDPVAYDIFRKNFQKLFSLSNLSAVDVVVPGVAAAVDAFGVQETSRMAVNDAAAMSFFMFLILIHNKCNKFRRALIHCAVVLI
jgi:hypothetical protein